jgi:hypothetical protein
MDVIMTKTRLDKSVSCEGAVAGPVRPVSRNRDFTGIWRNRGSREYITRKSLGISGNTCDRETLQVARCEEAAGEGDDKMSPRVLQHNPAGHFRPVR